MKSIIATVLFLLLVGSSLTSFAKPTPSHVHILSRRMDCFYFKVDKEAIGAHVEVFNQYGKKIADKILTTRRNILDFFNENPGYFTIKITKGSEIQETFEYHKVNPFPFLEVTVEPVSLVPLP